MPLIVNGNPYEITKEGAEDLKEYAKIHNIPIITAVQENNNERYYTATEVRDLVLNFWFYWYNSNTGTNTYEAFDKWFKVYNETGDFANTDYYKNKNM